MVKTTVQQDMGTLQFQFFELVGNGSYKYTNSDKTFPMHNKWNDVLSQIGQAKHVILLTRTRPAPNSKSGFSYDILGVFAVVANTGELEFVNSMYWNHLALKTTNFAKAEATLDFADKIRTAFEEGDRMSSFSEHTYEILRSRVMAMKAMADYEQQKILAKTEIRGLSF